MMQCVLVAWNNLARGALRWRRVPQGGTAENNARIALQVVDAASALLKAQGGAVEAGFDYAAYVEDNENAVAALQNSLARVALIKEGRVVVMEKGANAQTRK